MKKALPSRSSPPRPLRVYVYIYIHLALERKKRRWLFFCACVQPHVYTVSCMQMAYFDLRVGLPKGRVLFSAWGSLLHRESDEQPCFQLSAAGGRATRVMFYCIASGFVSLTEELLRRHGAKSISVCLGKYGAQSECPGWK